MNACLENVGRTAMSRAFLLAIVGCFACGSSEVRKERALSPEVARLGMALTTDTPSDPFVRPVMDALSRHFVDAGYLIVQRDARQAQVVGTISVTSRREESILRITVNGQQSISYDVTVQLTIAGRDREIVDQLQEGFSAKYGRADEDAVRKIVWQVRAHRKLDAYSKKIARVDAERMKQDALPAAVVSAAQPDADSLVDQLRSGGHDFSANKLEVALRALEKGDLRTFREIRQTSFCQFSGISGNDDLKAACKFLQGLDLPKGTSSAPGAERMKQDARERERNRQSESASFPPTSSLSTASERPRPAKTPAWLQKAGGKGDGGLDKESRLAVLEFSGPLEATVLMVLSDEVRGVALRAVAEHPCSVITRESMAVILKDMGLQCEEGDCEVETGRNIGADLVVSGSVARIEGTFVATLKLHETARGALLASARATAPTALELIEAIKRSSAELFK
jgi:hypothetical protein